MHEPLGVVTGSLDAPEGSLLLVTPWHYHYRRADEAITVAECKTMNCVVQALCRISDDWWKQE